MIPIVFSTDHNFVMPTGVTICSLLMNSQSEKYDIYVLIGNDVTGEDKAILSRQVNELSADSSISFISMGDDFSKGFEIRNISKACYYRIMIPWLLPDIDKIIYCDVDTIIKSSLKGLYDFDIEGYYVAGGKPYNWLEMKKYLARIGLDYKDYINSGVLLINSKLQRQAGLDAVYRQHFEKKYLYQDQDIINIVCKGKIAYFGWNYNLLPNRFGTRPEFTDNVIIHYAGDKPWRNFTYAWDEWWEIYKKSLFWDGEFYVKVCSRILDPISYLKGIRKKSKDKFRQLLAKF